MKTSYYDILRFSFVLILLVSALTSCNPHSSGSLEEYPDLIDTRVKKKQFDLAKWTLYIQSSILCYKHNGFIDNLSILKEGLQFTYLRTEDNIEYYTFFLEPHNSLENILDCNGHIYWYNIGYDPGTLNILRIGGSDYFEYDYNPMPFSDSLMLSLVDKFQFPHPWIGYYIDKYLDK